MKLIQQVILAFLVLESSLANEPARKSSKILFYMPYVSKSMKITFMPVAEELAKRGHDVTVVMPHASKSKSAVKEIIIESEFDKITREFSNKALTADGVTQPPIGVVVRVGIETNINALTHPEMKRLTNDPKTKFDIVVSSTMMGNEAGYYLAHHFNGSLALYFTGQVSFTTLDYAMGQPHNPAYLVSPNLDYQHPMTLIQRTTNLFVSIFIQLARDYYLLPKYEEMLDKLFPNEDRPGLLELEHKAALAFSFGHPLLMDGNRPVAPNFVNVGMMNCRKTQPLPKDLQKFMDSGKENGVIYVSFGSVLQASQMSEDRRKMLLFVFGKLKQKVLWKWETEEMPDKPANVKLSKWLPQQDILGHPNTKLFVTHVGQSSFQETLCHKKPVVAVPVFGDQPANAREAERLGFGIAIPFPQLTSENLYQAIQSVMTDPKYTAHAEEHGTLLQDQIDRPLDRAIWWIEHLLRHPGLPHLRSPVHDLAWYQYFMLDIFTLFAAIIHLSFKIIYWCCNCCCGKAAQNDVSGRKKNQ